MKFENSLQLGNGIYTVREISRILRIPYYKVHLWLNKYWDGELGELYKGKYSWTIQNSKAVGFHTLIEFYVMVQFAEAGVKTRQVLNAHRELSEDFDTVFPFAQKKILENIQTDGYRIYLITNGNIITLDGSQQFNLKFIRTFFKKLDFDENMLASRLWPLGKDKSILIDPKRKFGHPIIGNTNIYPETIYDLIKAGEPENFIAFTYEISEKEIKDVIEYCKAA